MSGRRRDWGGFGLQRWKANVDGELEAEDDEEKRRGQVESDGPANGPGLFLYGGRRQVAS